MQYSNLYFTVMWYNYDNEIYFNNFYPPHLHPSRKTLALDDIFLIVSYMNVYYIKINIINISHFAQFVYKTTKI